LRSEKASGVLWLTNTVIVEVVEAGQSARDGTRVILTTVEGKKSGSSRGGRAVFKDVVLGTLRVQVKDPVR
jgi:hypothetical protein